MPRAEDLEYIWELIDKYSAAANELRIRESDKYQIAGQSVIFAVDNGQNRLLLIPIAPDAHIQEDRRSSGVQTALRVLIDGSLRRSFLAVICLKPHLNSLFSIIAAEIIERLQVDASSPDIKSHQVLNRWRELFERAPSDLPRREVLVGVFGELYVLRQLVQHAPNALCFWDGADQARHDFLARSAALEVKTTTDRNRLCVTIRRHDQLEPPPGSALYLALIRLERVRTGGESLFDIVHMIADMGADRMQLLTQLAKLDITYDMLVQLKEEKYVVRNEFIYKIDEDFPKITSASFTGGKLPEHISTLTYQIDLSTQPPYPIPPDEAQALLKQFALEAST